MSADRRPWWAFGCSGELTERDLANLWRYNAYLIATLLTWLVALFLIKERAAEQPIVIALAIVPALLCVKFLQSAVRFLDQADELTRRIQVHAFAVGFAAGFVAILGEAIAGQVAEQLALGFDLADLFQPMVWMALAYSVAVVRLQLSYSR